MPTDRITVPKFAAQKDQSKKLAMLTAYDYPSAALLDAAGVDGLLVGDSLGMVVQGRDTTLAVTLDQMIYHAEMVARAAKRALVVVDLPFLSYHVSPRQAVRNAGRVLKETGAPAVKIEGGIEQTKTVAALVRAGIPVMGHIGLRPQMVHALGGLNKVQRDRNRLLEDAQAIANAGVFSMVLELIPADLAAEVTAAVSVPTIGIGAGPRCDGQVLVTPDLLGLTVDFHPKFLKRYANLHETIGEAVRSYVQEVQSGAFPTAGQSH